MEESLISAMITTILIVTTLLMVEELLVQLKKIAGKVEFVTFLRAPMCTRIILSVINLSQ